MTDSSIPESSPPSPRDSDVRLLPPSDYAAKLARHEGQTLLPYLEAKERRFVRRQAEVYRFTLQELRQVAQAARDLEMWCEEPLGSWWRGAEKEIRSNGRERKKALLRRLEQHLAELASGEKAYPQGGLLDRPRRRVSLREKETSKSVFGLCPAYSERTVCCGLRTLDAVRGCAFSCSYCTIQTFYGDAAELEVDLAAKLRDLEIDPDRGYHIGTGQSSDSLVWGNRGGLLDDLLDFAADHPNVLLELKTKSDNVRDLLAREIPANVVCSWSINTPTIILSEEVGTASLDRRLCAARQVADAGVRVAFHFHPMVFYSGWQEDYRAVATELVGRFAPAEIGFLSMGSVTFIRPVVRQIRRRGGATKILQMSMTTDPHGKLTYPDEIKVRLFAHLYRALAPWQGKVFFYLCMEPATIWRRILGHAYPTNADFEVDFLRHCLRPRTSWTKCREQVG